MTKRMSTKKKTDGDASTVVVVPGANDVLFGRGGHVNHNPANQRYLELVVSRKDQYHSCKKVDKASIAWDIIRELRQLYPPTRFLKKDYSTGLWHVVKDSDVRRKISQCLRERGTPVIPSPKKKKGGKKTSKKQPPSVSAAPMRVTRSVSRTMSEEAFPNSDGLEEVTSSDQTERRSSDASDSRASVETAVDSLPEVNDYAAQEVPAMRSPKTPRKAEQVPFHSQDGMVADTSSADMDDEPSVVGPPPLPPPKPIKPESSSRVWSEIFARSLGSHTPSIFDFSTGKENVWEHLLDNSMLPQLCADDDEESFPDSHSSEEMIPESVASMKRTYAQQAMAPSGDNALGGWHEASPESKRQKTLQEPSPDGRTTSSSLDAFFSYDLASLDNALGLGRVYHLSTTGF